MSSANNRQVAGSHYQDTASPNGLQHWDLVAMFGWDYFQGQITKYIMRWKHKNGIEDLKKAAHYLQKYIETEEAKLKDQQDLMVDMCRPEPRHAEGGE